jgi:hypothetical protein
MGGMRRFEEEEWDKRVDVLRCSLVQVLDKVLLCMQTWVLVLG